MRPIVNLNSQVLSGMVYHVYVRHNMLIVAMEYVSTINTVAMANVIMAKLLQHVHKNVQNAAVMVCVVQWNIVIIVQMIVASAPKCLGVVIICVIMVKTVAHVLVIVDHVLQMNIVGIMSVTMVKHVIRVGQIVQNVPKCVAMVNVLVMKIVCHVLLIVVHAHLPQIVEMDFVIVYTSHVVYVQVIVARVYHRIVGMGLVTVMNHVETVLTIVDHVRILVEMDTVILQGRLVHHVLMIVDHAQILVEMGIVTPQQNRAALVPVIVAHAHQLSSVVMGHVILEKIVEHVQAIVEHAQQLAHRLTNMDLWKGGNVF